MKLTSLFLMLCAISAFMLGLFIMWLGLTNLHVQFIRAWMRAFGCFMAGAVLASISSAIWKKPQ